MTNKYQKPFNIPEEFPNLLKSFTREVLRAQPPSVFEFGARYFSELIQQRQSGSDKIALENLSPADLEAYVSRMLSSSDMDGSGYLKLLEVIDLLESKDMSLDQWQIRKLVSELTENEDGTVEYHGLIPVILDVMNMKKALQTSWEDICEPLCLLNGVNRPEFEKSITAIFKDANKENSAGPSKAEFKEKLRTSALGLTQKDVNLILGHLKTVKNDAITLETVLRSSFHTLAQRHEDSIILKELTTSTENIQQDLLDAFCMEDKNNTGVLPLHAAQRILKRKAFDGLGLTAYQIGIILSSASSDDNCEIEYGFVAQMCAQKVANFRDKDMWQIQKEVEKRASCIDNINTTLFATTATTEWMLQNTFKEADPSNSGFLKFDQIKDIFEKLVGAEETKVSLPKEHLDAILFSLDIDENNNVEYNQLTQSWTGVLNHITRDCIFRELTDQRST